MGKRHLALMLGLASLAGACASGGDSHQPPATGAFQAIGPALPSAQAPTGDYKLGAFDKIAVAVYQMPELTVPEIVIDASGVIALPHVGQVNVMGKTVGEVTDVIKAKLSDCCLVNPQVTVTLREAVSQVITINGAVRTPNNYPIRGRITLSQAIAMANGPDMASANIKRIGVLRNINGQRQGATFDLQAIYNGRATDPEILPGDNIIVDTSDTKSTWHTVIQSMPLLGVFTLF